VRIGIQTWGSEGDIRPFVALGHALTARGHTVELLYTEISDRRYEHVAEALGFTARAVASPIVANPDELFSIGLQAINAHDELQQGLFISRRMLEPVMPQMYDAGLDLASRSDLFIHHFIVHGAGAAAEKAGTPAITLAFAHLLVPSRHIHPAGLPRLGEWGNLLGWKLAGFALNRTLLKNVNALRRRVGLAPLADLMRGAWQSPLLHLIAASPALLARPSDWPASIQMCGFLSLPAHEHETVAPEVTAFLDAGPAPVFMGFGSLMPTSGPHLDATLAIFTEAARLSGQRAIIQAEVDRPATDQVLYVRRTPHARVFPRCAAVVHHAGAGTTHATLAAGVSSVPVPHVSDQFGWSAELHRLGVAPAPLRRTRLTAAALADRIRATAGNARMAAAARDLQRRMAGDDGPATAATLVERAMTGHGV
jgi:sterol 3beta-glucosyltransferase